MAKTQRAVPESLQQTWERATQDPDPIVALGAVRAFWEQWAWWQAALVSEALTAGGTWDDIGRALGTSRQAAWARFRKMTEEEDGGAGSMRDEIARVRNQSMAELKALQEELRRREERWRGDRKRLQEQMQSLQDQMGTLDNQRADDRERLQEEIRRKKGAMQDRIRALGAGVPAQ